MAISAALCVSMAPAKIGLVGNRSRRRPISGMARTMVIADAEKTRAAVWGSTPWAVKIET